MMILHGFELDNFIQKTIDHYDALKTLSAGFEMYSCDEMTGMCKNVEGKIYYRQPFAFRLEFRDPDVFYIGDSTVLWIYFPAQKKAIKQNMESVPWQVQPASFLKEFGTRYNAEEKLLNDTSVTVVLRPIDETDLYDYIELIIDRSSLMIKNMTIADKAGSERKIEFFEQKINKKISKSIFNFKPPADTEIDEY